MRAIGYIRVSTDEQARHGFGLAAQEKAIKSLCKRKGWKLARPLHRDEGVSGSNGLDSRVGLAAALVQCEAGTADVLVVSKLDRLARDLRLQLTIVARLEKVGVEVVSVEEPDVEDEGMREFIRNVLGSMAQYERTVIRGRMAAGKAAKKAADGYVGGRPGYGSKAQAGRLVADEDETAAVALIRSHRAAGGSYRDICTALKAAGHTPRSGKDWQPAVVRRIALRAD